MKDAVLYIHGKGGSAAECEHYKPLFPDCEVFGLDYQTFTPWETGAEIRTAVEKLKDGYESIILIANSIGAFFCMNAGIDGMHHFLSDASSILFEGIVVYADRRQG
jgi:hypothetical protein